MASSHRLSLRSIRDTRIGSNCGTTALNLNSTRRGQFVMRAEALLALLMSLDCARGEHRRDNGTEDAVEPLTQSMRRLEAPENSGFNKLLLVPILLLVLATMGTCWLCWRRRTSGHVKLSMTATSGRDDSYQPYQGEELGRTSDQPSTSKKDSKSADTNTTMKLLLGSKHLRGKRIPYESLTLEEAPLSRDVSICEYNGQKVAARKLPQSEQNAEKIELNASLAHPNIVQFIGVAWRDLSELTIVREFLPIGSLQAYLQANVELSWTEEKTRIALGIAQALEYLHGRRPHVTHGEIKAKNVLLTENLEPKLVEIGSRGATASYWTAPEVLEGKQSTQQADIYSFGVLLTELDTGKAPYSDTMTKTGIKLKPSQVLQLVKTGKLRPHLSKNCSLRIQRLGAACLAHNSSNRPSARQLVRQLEGVW